MKKKRVSPLFSDTKSDCVGQSEDYVSSTSVAINDFEGESAMTAHTSSKSSGVDKSCYDCTHLQ